MRTGAYMAWDDSKDTFQDRPDVPDDEKLRAAEWNNHVSDQQNRGYTDLATVTTDYTASPQEIVLADASSGPLAIELPPTETATGTIVKKIDSTTNAVTVATPGTETIDGDAERTLTAQYVSREITSDGSNYYII